MQGDGDVEVRQDRRGEALTDRCEPVALHRHLLSEHLFALYHANNI
jgi:hypothetical protein